MKKASFQQRYYVNAQGGGDVARYFLSIGGQFEDAAYKQSDVKFKRPVAHNKLTYRANIDMDLTRSTQLYCGVDGHFLKHTLTGMENNQSFWKSVRLFMTL